MREVLMSEAHAIVKEAPLVPAGTNPIGGGHNREEINKMVGQTLRSSIVFSILCKVTLDQSEPAIQRSLGTSKYRVGAWARDILRDLDLCSRGRGDIRLVSASVAKLGLDAGEHYGTICARARQLGLELCPAAVGPALRVAYAQELNDECLVIGM